jgi:ribonuclease HI
MMTAKNALFVPEVIAYTDGGARGNPGPAASAAVVDGKPYGEYLGVATNNVAEYKGVILALKKIRQTLGATKCKHTKVEIRMDSQLIQRQLLGEYRISEDNLKPLYVDVWNLAHFEFKEVRYVHIPREKNKDADAEVNRILDEATRRGGEYISGSGI